MIDKIARKVSRAATAEERERHAIIREQIKDELPDIKIRAKQMLDEAIQHNFELLHTVSFLRAERIRKGLTLSDITRYTGLENSTLSRLENRE